MLNINLKVKFFMPFAPVKIYGFKLYTVVINLHLIADAKFVVLGGFIVAVFKREIFLAV